jgi:aspartate aminotransferase
METDFSTIATETSVVESPNNPVVAAFPESASPRVSSMAAGLIGSEILKIAADIRALVASGTPVCNLTVGDFNSKYFPIPQELLAGIEQALENGETNYPPSDGMLDLRKAVQEFYARELKLQYPIESFIITSGARPAIYATYRALVEPDDKVIFPTPSWNNNHYCHLVKAFPTPVACSPEEAFLPTREKLEQAIIGARLIVLCSPLNPTGTAFTREALTSICDLILEENAKRKASGGKPIFLMYDQVYWMLTFGETKHVNPVSLRPEMANYTIFVDGISKAFASTGVRVGWAVAPPDIAASMSNILGHVGAWAPRAEQVATATLLRNESAILKYHAHMKQALSERLNLLYDGLRAMRSAGKPVDAIPPMGAIYLTANFALIGRHTPTGEKLETNEDIRKYLLSAAQLAVVPFQAFGSREETGWFRLSVGAVSMEEIREMLPRLERAIGVLQ